jgi:protein SCO1/2
MNPVLPLPDPLAPAAPAWIFAVLLDVTFFLHLLAMNLLLGGALLLLGLRLGRGRAHVAHREALGHALEKAAPLAMAATATLGLAPLLFLQALHGRVFFTSSILMGWLWLAIVPIAILAYYGAYALALRPRGGGGRRWANAAVSGLVLGVAFLQTTNASRSLRLETLREAQLLDPRGLLLNLSDPTFWPRLLHFALGAFAFAALATAWLGWRWRSTFPERAEWVVRRAVSLFALATAVNVFVGLGFLISLPRPVLIRLVGGGTGWSMALLAASLLLAVALAGAAFLAPGARRRAGAALALGGLLLATLAAMTLLRDEVRRVTFANAAVDPLPAAAPQWGAAALFGTLLVAGVAVILWMVRSLGAGRAVVPLLAIALLASGACRRDTARPHAGEPSRYPLRGRVVEVDRASRTLTIAHDEIVGFMPAMTMDYVVRQKDAAVLDGIGPGDEITATLVVPDSRYWIEDVVVVKKGEGTAEVKPEPGVTPGSSIPDVTLVDQDGRTFHLSAMKGRAYVVTFVYTRCPLPDYCPLMMKNFAAAEALLVADPRLREATRLLTVSFDPKHDTPEVLKKYGRPFQKTTPPFTHWTLATGTDDAIRTLGAAFGLEYDEQTGSFTHNLRTAVVDPQGHLVRLLRGNEWKPAELVDAVRKAAGR